MEEQLPQFPQQARRGRSSGWVAGALALVVLAAAVAGGWLLLGDRNRASAENDNPIAALPSSTTTPPTTPSSAVAALPELPQPQDAPKDPNARVPIIEAGELDIPKIGLVHKVYEGVWLTVIDVGPGHWPGTAEPGGYGNTVYAGHRVTHDHPFRDIDKLEVGDDIMVRDAHGQTFTYKVTGHDVVSPEQIDIVDQTPGYRLTLFACHPPGSATYRYVVHADLVDPAPPPLPTA